ncbi:hypothetical protein L596_020061 [Steinernema carpocapsae]|uniref:Uncharacterized protein n=1 Tax=Steinernema carpocapsae TaxID=34508 RepID=A0A4U5MSJ4_STECR|nr:hypothetical protein L596_020061 [Steinernema carpocapsae]
MGLKCLKSITEAAAPSELILETVLEQVPSLACRAELQEGQKIPIEFGSWANPQPKTANFLAGSFLEHTWTFGSKIMKLWTNSG